MRFYLFPLSSRRSLSLLLTGSVSDVMREEFLPEPVPLFGSLFGNVLMVNPSFKTAFYLTLLVLVFALAFRFLIFPRFKKVPGGFQAVLEKACEMVEGLVKDNSSKSQLFLGAFSFASWVYIGLGTLCEILGIRAILVDLNACIALAVTAYGIMLFGGIRFNKLRGAGSVLKDFSLLLSISFRLFGSMIGGLLMTALVYHYIALSIGIPVLVGVIFTLFHAVIQSYVYTLLTAIFYGEASEDRVLTGADLEKKNKRRGKSNAFKTSDRRDVSAGQVFRRTNAGQKFPQNS